MEILQNVENVCIVGDPSTAKSQLLKKVADFSPRVVYSSGTNRLKAMRLVYHIS